MDLTLKLLGAFALVLGVFAVRRWRDGKSMRPTAAGTNRWVTIVWVIVVFVGEGE